MRLSKLLSVLSLSLLTGACATLISGQTQDVTLLTPGATEAECVFDNGVRYQVYTGETIKVMRNESDIKIDCYASGNRHRALNIESDGNTWAMGNVVTGIVPGVTFDHFSKGLYEYPETITVDFTGVPTPGFDLPAYHNKDAPNPYEQAIENYGPTVPKRRMDEAFIKTPVQKRVRGNTDPFSSGTPPSAGNNGITPLPGNVSGSGAAPAVPKGGNAEELTRSANPSVFRTN